MVWQPIGADTSTGALPPIVVTYLQGLFSSTGGDTYDDTAIRALITDGDADTLSSANSYTSQQVASIPAGPEGPKGDTGDQGIQGIPGTNATITSATATTGIAGSNASVTLGGTASARTFAFTIPRGDQGTQGLQGTQGIQGIKGDTGTAGTNATITGATVSTGAAGTSAAVTLGGTASARTFAFTIPRGDTGSQGIKGDTGDQGPIGPTGGQGIQGIQGTAGTNATITGATVTTGAAGTNASVVAGGTASARSFAFTIPRGDQGIQGTQGIKGDTGDQGIQGIQGIPGVKGDTGDQGIQGIPGTSATITDTTVTTGAAGTNASVTLGGTASARTFAFTIPRGDQGIQGIQGIKGDQGIQGVPGQDGTGIQITGSVATENDLPTTGNTTGDAYIANDTGLLHVWDGSVWGAGVQFRGPQGIQGEPGEKGDPGDNVTDSTVAGFISATGSDSRTIVETIAGTAEDNAITYTDSVKWSRPDDLTPTDLNSYITPGLFRVTRGGVANRPFAQSGMLEVFTIDSTIIQLWLTRETMPRLFSRSRNTSGVWATWSTITWRAGSTSSAIDFNSLTAPGAYEVANSGNPNSPNSLPGTLEVFPIGSNIVVQRFTTTETAQRVFLRQYQSSSWTTWVSAPTRAEFTILQGKVSTLESATVNAPIRSAIGSWNPTIEQTLSADYIIELDLDRNIGFNGSHPTGRLRETRDLGATWTEIHQFASNLSWVKVLDNGEILACVGADPDPRELWLSSGRNQAVTEWNKVLTASAPYVTFTSAWSVSTYKNIILVNEYGPKTGALWNGGTIATGENARYTYLSTDSGLTWSTVFDLNDYLITQQGAASTDVCHLHGVAWDPYWDRIWITYGDDLNGTVYSDDLGSTWHTAHYGNTVGAPHQNVGIYAMPKAILFGTDVAPNGVQRIDRALGKSTGLYTIEQAYTVPGDDGTNRTHLCQAIHKVKREGNDGPVLFGFSSETNTAPNFIVATRDGFNFTLLWTDTYTPPTPGQGLRTIAGPTLSGSLVVGSNDPRFAGYWAKIHGQVPIY